MKKSALPQLFLLVITPFSAHAATVFSNYNVYVKGNFTGSNSDIGGGLAAGGTIDLTNYTIFNNPLSDSWGSYTLVAGADLKAQNGSLKQGNAYDPIAGGISSFSINSGSLNGPPTAAPLDFTAAASGINTWSTVIAGYSANGTASLSGSTLTLTGTDATRNVFNVSAAQLSGNTTINIVVPKGATAIINVSGTTASTTTAQINFNGFTINGDSTDASARNVLWNYYQATTLSLQGGMFGSVLAPNAAVTAGFTQFDGQLLASSYSGNTEFHNFDFNGTLSPSTPEPVPVVLSGIGLAAIALMAWRRKQHSVSRP